MGRFLLTGGVALLTVVASATIGVAVVVPDLASTQTVSSPAGASPATATDPLVAGNTAASASEAGPASVSTSSVVGKVVLPAGVPLSDVTVVRTLDPMGLQFDATTLDSNGAFRFDGADSQQWPMQVRVDSKTDLFLTHWFPGTTDPAHATWYPEPASGLLDLGSITVPATQPPPVTTGTINGTVYLPSGVGSAGVIVEAQGLSSGTTTQRAEVSATGTYSVAGLKAGSYQVCLVPLAEPRVLPGCYTGKVQVVAGFTNFGVDFTVKRASQLSGQVVLPATIDYRDVRVEAVEASTGITRADTRLGPDGGTGFTLWVRPGSYQVRAVVVSTGRQVYYGPPGGPASTVVLGDEQSVSGIRISLGAKAAVVIQGGVPAPPKLPPATPKSAEPVAVPAPPSPTTPVKSALVLSPQP